MSLAAAQPAMMDRPGVSPIGSLHSGLGVAKNRLAHHFMRCAWALLAGDLQRQLKEELHRI